MSEKKKKAYTPLFRICNNPQCLNEFITLSHRRFYCETCRAVKKKELNRKWREANPGKNMEYKRRHLEKLTEDQKEEIRRRAREKYHGMNPEDKAELLRKHVAYQQAHQEQHRESARRWKAAQRALKRPVAIEPSPERVHRVVFDTAKPHDIEAAKIAAKLTRLEASGEYIFCERMKAKLKKDYCGERPECRLGRDGCPRCPKDKLKARRPALEELW